MACAIIKIAYFSFIFSLITWLVLLFSNRFSNIILATQIGFPNSSTLTAFMVSGGIAGISCGIIGLNYLGINFNLKLKKTSQIMRDKSHTLRQSPLLIEKDVKVPELEISVIKAVEKEEITCLDKGVQTKRVKKSTQRRRDKNHTLRQSTLLIEKDVKVPELEISVIKAVEKEEITCLDKGVQTKRVKKSQRRAK
jgi:predicted transcriptional regulator